MRRDVGLTVGLRREAGAEETGCRGRGDGMPERKAMGCRRVVDGMLGWRRRDAEVEATRRDAVEARDSIWMEPGGRSGWSPASGGGVWKLRGVARKTWAAAAARGSRAARERTGSPRGNPPEALSRGFIPRVKHREAGRIPPVRGLPNGA